MLGKMSLAKKAHEKSLTSKNGFNDRLELSHWLGKDSGPGVAFTEEGA
jgi:hypothetical protein